MKVEAISVKENLTPACGEKVRGSFPAGFRDSTREKKCSQTSERGIREKISLGKTRARKG